MPDDVTSNLQPAGAYFVDDGGVYTFVKSVRKANQTRRYTIQTTASGWEVREEEGTEITGQRWYQDWHRVERARLSISMKLDVLREQGWRDV